MSAPYDVNSFNLFAKRVPQETLRSPSVLLLFVYLFIYIFIYSFEVGGGGRGEGGRESRKEGKVKRVQ